MKNILSAEFYYLLKNIRYYIFIVLVAAGHVAGIIMNNTLITAVMQLVTIVFCAILVLEFSHKDFKNKTMKNYVGCGIPLSKVYFSKLIVCLVAVTIILLISNSLNEIAKIVCDTNIPASFSISKFIVSLFVYIVEIIVVFFFCSFIRSGVLSILVAVLYTCVAPFAINMIQNDIIAAIRPYFSFNILQELEGTDMLGAAIEGAATGVTPELLMHMGVSILIAIALSCLGAFLYSKREVK